jgi:hypothetical protein
VRAVTKGFDNTPPQRHIDVHVASRLVRPRVAPVHCVRIPSGENR